MYYFQSLKVSDQLYCHEFWPVPIGLPDDRIGQGVGRPKDKLCRSFGLGALPDLEFEINHLKRSFVCRNNLWVTHICRAFAYFDFPQWRILFIGILIWKFLWCTYTQFGNCVMVLRMHLVIFCKLNIYMFFSGSVNQSFYSIKSQFTLDIYPWTTSARYLIDWSFGK